MAFGQQGMLTGADSFIQLSASYTPSGFAVSPATATAQFKLTAAGDVKNGVAETDIGDWITPKVGMAFYECQMNVTVGTLDSGPVGSYVALSSDRTWTLTQSGIGINTAVATLTIRKIGTTTVLATSTITFTAEVDA